jgi:hypothetical protein
VPVFYRVVRTDTPSIGDLLSLEAKGRIPRNATPRQERLSSGISVFDTVTGAERVARQVQGRLGWFLAELTIPEGDPIGLAYELTGANGHYTLWGDPSLILTTLTRVFKIEHGAGD